MALTGLFLCLFLVVHLFGNLQLLSPVEVAQWQFNSASGGIGIPRVESVKLQPGERCRDCPRLSHGILLAVTDPPYCEML
jgi:hypothetical protein